MADEPEGEVDLADLEARLNAGEWLTPRDVGALLDLGRTAVHNRLASGQIRWKPKGGGRKRLCRPEDVRRLLDAAREVQSGPRGEPPGPADV